MVTNDFERNGQHALEHHWKRCGKSEEVHGILKNDLAGGHVPSADFGSCAVWWYLCILSYNHSAAHDASSLSGGVVTGASEAVVGDDLLGACEDGASREADSDTRVRPSWKTDRSRALETVAAQSPEYLIFTEGV